MGAGHEMVSRRARGGIDIIAAMARIAVRLPVVLTALAVLPACATTRAARGPDPEAPPLALAVVRTARGYLPEEGGRRATPADCSDFVGRVFRENGVSLPRTSAAMAKLGSRVPQSRLRMGDLLFFAGSWGGWSVGHVGIYVRNGVFIHEPSSASGVRMESLDNSYYRRRYLKARRVIE